MTESQQSDLCRPPKGAWAGGARHGRRHCSSRHSARPGSRRPATALSAEQALAALKDGNKRFVSQPQLCTLDLAKHRDSVAEHQAPWAIIVGCADSRVPPELLFGGLGVGELFVARNAGNLIDHRGGRHRRVRRCRARCAPDRRARPSALRRGCGGVRRGRQERDVSGLDRPDDRPDPACRDRGARQARRLRRQHDPRKREAQRRPADDREPDAGELVKGGKLKIVAAHYDLDRGNVEFLT